MEVKEEETESKMTSSQQMSIKNEKSQSDVKGSNHLTANSTNSNGPSLTEDSSSVSADNPATSVDSSLSSGDLLVVEGISANGGDGGEGQTATVPADFVKAKTLKKPSFVVGFYYFCEFRFY